MLCSVKYLYFSFYARLSAGLCGLFLFSISAVEAAESVVIPVPDYRPPQTVQRVAVPIVPDSKVSNVLIVTGESSYERDWTGVNTQLRSLMLNSGASDVRVIEDPRMLNADILTRYDVVFINYLGRWNYSDSEETRWGHIAKQALLDFAKNGGGVVLYHASFNMGAPSWPDFYAQAIAGPKYPPSLYTPEKLAGMSAMAADKPQVWTVEYGTGRVFCIALGHGPDTLLHDGVQSLILRGTQWAATGDVSLPIGPKARAFSE